VVVEKLLQMHPDGRMDILTRGRRRFAISALNEEKAYLQAEVEFFDDDDFAPTPPDLRDQALSRFHDLCELSDLPEHSAPNLEDPQLSFQLAQSLPDIDFLHSLLRHRSETGRLQQLILYLDAYIPRQRAIQRMKLLAPTNGFGGRPAGI
jgi:hypothetical protein